MVHGCLYGHQSMNVLDFKNNYIDQIFGIISEKLKWTLKCDFNTILFIGASKILMRLSVLFFLTFSASKYSYSAFTFNEPFLPVNGENYF